MQYLNIKERGKEPNSDTEEVLREFMRSKLKIPASEENPFRESTPYHYANDFNW